MAVGDAVAAIAAARDRCGDTFAVQSGADHYLFNFSPAGVVTHLLCKYELTAGWQAHPRPVPAQVGGVARADGPCPGDYLAVR